MSVCPKCSAEVAWRRQPGPPVYDRLSCEACDYIEAVDRRVAPLRPLVAEACVNCCAPGIEEPVRSPRTVVRRRRKGSLAFGSCPDCGMSALNAEASHEAMIDEVEADPNVQAAWARFNESLRDLGHEQGPPGRSFLQAARAAMLGGRVVLGLKLATAAATYDADPSAARLLRLRLLTKFGARHVRDDAVAWLEESGRLPPDDWAERVGWLSRLGEPVLAAGDLQRLLEAYPSPEAFEADGGNLVLYDTALHAAASHYRGTRTATPRESFVSAFDRATRGPTAAPSSPAFRSHRRKPGPSTVLLLVVTSVRDIGRGAVRLVPAVAPDGPQPNPGDPIALIAPDGSREDATVGTVHEGERGLMIELPRRFEEEPVLPGTSVYLRAGPESDPAEPFVGWSAGSA